MAITSGVSCGGTLSGDGWRGGDGGKFGSVRVLAGTLDGGGGAVARTGVGSKCAYLGTSGASARYPQDGFLAGLALISAIGIVKKS